MSDGAGIALVMCIRDEESLLDSHLRFHHLLGVERAYLFLDRCRDRCEDIARSFPWVTVFRRDRAPGIRYILQHQNQCAAEALQHARSDGMRNASFCFTGSHASM